MRDVAVIDYGMGNLRSVLKAWEAVGARSRLIESPSEISERDILVFPGQGAIMDTMELLSRTGFDAAIAEWTAADKPFFGICLGLQALFEESEEGGSTPGLGILKGKVRRFNLPREIKVPHMGWDDVCFKPDQVLLDGIEPGDQFYFVHSFYADCSDSEAVFGTSEYGGVPFTSVVKRGRMLATQFHPEKSQSKGLKLYSNYLKYVS